MEVGMGMGKEALFRMDLGQEQVLWHVRRGYTGTSIVAQEVGISL